MRTIYPELSDGEQGRERGSGQGLSPASLLGKRPDMSAVGWAYEEGILGHGPAA